MILKHLSGCPIETDHWMNERQINATRAGQEVSIDSLAGKWLLSGHLRNRRICSDDLCCIWDLYQICMLLPSAAFNNLIYICYGYQVGDQVTDSFSLSCTHYVRTIPQQNTI
jgi:hypothetical protein